MSDDDYNAESPFDGFDDYYWDDDTSQNLADDLAEHTMPSPVYLEDPAYELTGGYSDWDYYSDDYYDDDPELLNKDPQAGSPPTALRVRNGGAGTQDGKKRGRKRKLADTEHIPAISLGDSELVKTMLNAGNNIKGTVWKTNEAEPEQVHLQGEANRVALLKDWKNVFRESQPKSDRRSLGNQKKSILQEEWANNLGLAEMGLLNSTGKGVNVNGAASDFEQGSENESVVDEDAEYDEMAAEGSVDMPLGDDEGYTEHHLDDNDDTPTTAKRKIRSKKTDLQHSAEPAGQNLLSRKRKKRSPEEAKGDYNTSDTESGVELQLVERTVGSNSKKRKTKSTGRPSSQSTREAHAATRVSTAPTVATNGTQKRGRAGPSKPSTASTETAKSAAPAAPKGKKRKADADEDEDGNEDRDENDKTRLQSRAMGPTTASRAKRIASSKTAIRKDDANKGSSEDLPPVPTGRVAAAAAAAAATTKTATSTRASRSNRKMK